MKGMASSTMLTNTIAKELRGLDCEPEGRKTTAAARKSAGR
jgi:galactitol-specific phosphotransferase system IIB component